MYNIPNEGLRSSVYYTYIYQAAAGIHLRLIYK